MQGFVRLSRSPRARAEASEPAATRGLERRYGGSHHKQTGKYWWPRSVWLLDLPSWLIARESPAPIVSFISSLESCLMLLNFAPSAYYQHSYLLPKQFASKSCLFLYSIAFIRKETFVSISQLSLHSSSSVHITTPERIFALCYSTLSLQISVCCFQLMIFASESHLLLWL